MHDIVTSFTNVGVPSGPSRTSGGPEQAAKYAVFEHKI